MAAADPDHGRCSESATEASSLTSARAAAGSPIRLASRVGPNGRVLAEDIQRPMIQAINVRVETLGLKNVHTVLGASNDPRLPEPVDAVLIVDAYHEMEQPVALLRNLVKSLKPSARVGIVNFTKEGGGPGPPMEERVDPERVISDADAAGLALRSRETFLQVSVHARVRTPLAA